MNKAQLKIGMIVRVRHGGLYTYMSQHPKCGEHDQYPKGKCFVSKYDWFINDYSIEDNLLCKDSGSNGRACDIMEVYEISAEVVKLDLIWKRPEIEYFEMTIEQIEEKLKDILKGRKLKLNTETTK